MKLTSDHIGKLLKRKEDERVEFKRASSELPYRTVIVVTTDDDTENDTVKHPQIRTRTTPVQHPYNEAQFRTTTVPIQDTSEAGCRHDDGHAGRMTLPARKRLNHRGPLSIDVSSAWYFITICAEGHAPWIADEVKIGRAVAPRPPSPTTSLETIAPFILREARENHNRGIWWLALFLVMPDHLHFIVNIGGRPATAVSRSGVWRTERDLRNV